MDFQLTSPYQPAGDQQQAIEQLLSGIGKNYRDQVLIGVTGSGKTFTMANVIARTNRPALVISHNKTLAGQLFQEFRDFFPHNAVSYFVSYYDYYQPEAYIPQTDTYIEKETDINEEIDKLRLAATMNILTRRDVIVVASVSCIYNIGSPREYGKFVLELAEGMKVQRKQIIERLVDLQYNRASYDFPRGSFRVRGDSIDVYLAYEDKALRILLKDDAIQSLEFMHPVSAERTALARPNPPAGGEGGNNEERITNYTIYPAKHYMTDPRQQENVFTQIRMDLDAQVAKFKKENKLLEAHRIGQRVKYDLEMLRELGYVNGIENYSRYFDGRNPGDPPYTLIDYFYEAYGKEWLLIIDESHMTIPQLNGMYNGDRARKQTLIDFGFRLPAALDNRPMKFDEFLARMPQTMYVSATPAPWEVKRSRQTVEQLVRPTGLVDPAIDIRPSKGQILDLAKEIGERVKRRERVLVTTLTKRTAEELARYLNASYTSLKVAHLHSDIETLDRQDILEDLRRGKYDVLVGINLLREGLDLPEVSLVAILDADKEGFLRSKTSLVQTMGRAARHVQGSVIMYADRVTNAMREAMEEVKRRRKIQLAYNEKHGITPVSIEKPIREKLIQRDPNDHKKLSREERKKLIVRDTAINPDALTPKELKNYKKTLRSAMRDAARDLDFETAAELRDRLEKIG